MGSFSDRIPKKTHKEAKQCAICKKHGDLQNTHNTGDCKKYNSDGTPKKGFAGKKAQCNLCNGSALQDQKANCAQLCAKLLNLKSQTGNSSAQGSNASVIMTATATTPTHPEAMGQVALGN